MFQKSYFGVVCQENPRGQTFCVCSKSDISNKMFA